MNGNVTNLLIIMEVQIKTLSLVTTYLPSLLYFSPEHSSLLNKSFILSFVYLVYPSRLDQGSPTPENWAAQQEESGGRAKLLMLLPIAHITA